MQTSRRNLLRNSLGLASAGTASFQATNAASNGKRGVQNGRIRQSVVSWCYAKHWSLDKTCQVAKSLGCQSVELVGPQDYPTLNKHGLTCAITTIDMGGPPFIEGWNNPKHYPKLRAATTKAIDAASEFGSPNVICFTGYANGISKEDGLRNCIKGLKEMTRYAEKKGVSLSLEMLNSRDSSDPNKGHPGYQGDHIDYCMEIINGVGSCHLNLLFDIYHVQIMDGDIIRRIKECGDAIGHIHTAGNPGRGELNGDQEINYPPIMKALLEIGYKGFVGQEFIPTGDPLEGLTAAVELCDV
jgi:hydroxypyruvate isomerase